MVKGHGSTDNVRVADSLCLFLSLLMSVEEMGGGKAATLPRATFCLSPSLVRDRKKYFLYYALSINNLSGMIHAYMIVSYMSKNLSPGSRC